MNIMNIAWNKLKKEYVRPNLDAPLAQHQGGYEPLAHAKRADAKDKHMTTSMMHQREADRRLNPGTLRNNKHAGMSGGHGVEGQRLEGVGQEQSFSTHGTGESVFDTPSFVHQGQNPESIHPTQAASQQMQQKKKEQEQPPLQPGTAGKRGARQSQPPQGQHELIARGNPMATNAAWSIIKQKAKCCPKCEPHGSTCEKMGC